GTRAGVGEALDLPERRWARLERAEGRVALYLPLHPAGAEQLAGREGGAPDHAIDVLCEPLLVPESVLNRRDTAIRKDRRRRLDCRRRVHRLRRDDAELALRKLLRVTRCSQSTDHVARAAEPEAALVDRLDVLLRLVVRPHLDVVQLRE